MVGQLYPDARLERVPVDHELFRLEIGHDIRKVKRRVVPAGAGGAKALATEVREGEPFLEGLRVDGRYVVIYSRKTSVVPSSDNPRSPAPDTSPATPSASGST
ncbi:MAG: hypothetical protein CM1200mP2_07690 [Planctomycetaceae bacterium]|nr:MAG: hypothetical protein CM1200mP2_07690 [Planctomycetaceae bacterium]